MQLSSLVQDAGRGLDGEEQPLGAFRSRLTWGVCRKCENNVALGEMADQFRTGNGKCEKGSWAQRTRPGRLWK